MIIDIHTHAWPQKIARKARVNLESLFKIKLICLPTEKALLRFMKKNNISVSVVCAVATKPEQVSSINAWLFKIRSRRLRVFCALHPEYKFWKDELRKIKINGDGIKLQPEFQDFYVDERRVYPMYEEIERLGLPILFHCGKELSGTMLVRSSPHRILKIRKRFPRLKIIAGHFGGFRLWKEVKKYLLGKDIYLDTSFFFGYLPRKEIRGMLLRHPGKRLLFGSDFPLTDPKNDLDYLKGLGLPEGLRKRILYLNAKELLQI